MKSGLRHVRYVVCVFILQGLDPVFFVLKNLLVLAIEMCKKK